MVSGELGDCWGHEAQVLCSRLANTVGSREQPEGDAREIHPEEDHGAFAWRKAGFIYLFSPFDDRY